GGIATAPPRAPGGPRAAAHHPGGIATGRPGRARQPRVRGRSSPWRDRNIMTTRHTLGVLSGRSSPWRDRNATLKAGRSIRSVAVKPDDTRHAALLACRSSIVSMVAGCGSLIHAFWGSAGGTGLRRNRAGWAA